MMNREGQEALDLRVQRAVEELMEVIQQRYPTATFQVARGEDDPQSVHLTAIVDVEDTDEVLDLVIDRVVDLQVEEGIPVHVIPIRAPERVLAAMVSQAALRRPRRLRVVPLLDDGQPLRGIG